MSLRSLGLLAAALAALASPALAQTITSLQLKDATGATVQEAGTTDGSGRIYPGHSLFGWTGSALKLVTVDASGNVLTKTAPYTTATPLTPGTPVTAGRALFLACTAAGTVRIKLSSGNTLDVPVYVGPNEISPYAVTDIVAANTTATCVATILG